MRTVLLLAISLLGLRLAAEELLLTPEHGLTARVISPAPQKIATGADVAPIRSVAGPQAEPPVRLLLAVNLEALPAGATIAQARLQVASPGNLPVTLHRVRREWQARADWTTSAPNQRWGVAGALDPKTDFESEALPAAADGSFDLSPTMQQWAYRQAPNRGLLLAAAAEAPGERRIDLKSLRLTITYGPPQPTFVPAAPRLAGPPEPGQDASASLAWEGGGPTAVPSGARWWFEVQYFVSPAASTKRAAEVRAQQAELDKARGQEKDQALEADMTNAGGTGDAGGLEGLGLAAPKVPDKGQGKAAKPKVQPLTELKSDWCAWPWPIAADQQFIRLDLRNLPVADGYRLRVRASTSYGLNSAWAESAPFALTQNNCFVWTTDTLTKFRPPSAPWPNSCRAQFAAARNETEGFQVLLRTGRQAERGIQFEVSELRGPQGAVIPQWAVTRYRQLWVNRTRALNEYQTEPLDPPDYWPDPLVPFTDRYTGKATGGRYDPHRVDCGPDELVGYWVDVYVPPRTPAGVYHGEAAVVLAGPRRLTIPVELEVFDFTLPRERSLRTAWSLCGYGGARVLVDRFVKELHDHRIDTYGAQVQPDVEVKDGRLASINWSRYDRTVRPYADGSLFADGVPMHQFAISPWYGGQDVPEAVNWFYSGKGRPADDVRADLFTEYFRQCRTHFMDLGILDYVWHYTDDEPGDNPNGQVVWNYVAFHLKKAIPEMARHITSVQLDYTEGHINLYNTNPDWVNRMLQTGFQARRRPFGDRFWCYNGFTYVTSPALAQRMLGWYAWRMQADGWLCWASCFGWSADPWALLHPWNGDGLFVYQGTRATIGTEHVVACANLELKYTRDGMEDLEYVRLAEQVAGREAVAALVREQVCMGGDPGQHFRQPAQHRHYGVLYENDPERFRATRRRLAELIVKGRARDGAVTATPEESVKAAAALLAAGQAAAALAKAKDALFVAPDSLPAGRLETECYRSLRMPQEALEAALRLVARNESAETWLVLAEVYVWRRQYDLAVAAAREALQRGLAGAAADRANALVQAETPPADGVKLFTLALPPLQRPGAREGITKGLPLYGGPNDPTPAGRATDLLQPDLRPVPAGRVIRAALVFDFTYRPDDPYFALAYCACPLLADWDAPEVTFYQRRQGVPWAEPGAGQPDVDRAWIPAPLGQSTWTADGNRGTLRIDVTGMLRDWLAGAVPYHGFMLIPVNSPVDLTAGRLEVRWVADPMAANKLPAPPPPKPVPVAVAPPAAPVPPSVPPPPQPGKKPGEPPRPPGTPALAPEPEIALTGEADLPLEEGATAAKQAERDTDLHILTQTQSQRRAPPGGAGTWEFVVDERARAAGRLAQFPDEAVVTALLKAAMGDPNPHVTKAARDSVMQLARRDRARFIPLFDQQLRQAESWWTRYQMAHLLAGLGGKEVRAILLRLLREDPSEDVRGPVGKLLMQQWDADLEPVFREVAKHEENTLLKSLIMWRLARRDGVKAVPFFVEVLREGTNWEARWMALEVLTWLKDTQPKAPELDATVPTIAKTAREDASERARFRATDALWHFPGAEATAALIAILTHDADFEIRAHAAMILGEQRVADAVPTLIVALGDKNEWVRYYAGRSLLRLGGPQATAAVAKLAQDPKPWVAKLAAAPLP